MGRGGDIVAVQVLVFWVSGCTFNMNKEMSTRVRCRDKNKSNVGVYYKVVRCSGVTVYCLSRLTDFFPFFEMLVVLKIIILLF